MMPLVPFLKRSHPTQMTTGVDWIAWAE